VKLVKNYDQTHAHTRPFDKIRMLSLTPTAPSTEAEIVKGEVNYLQQQLFEPHRLPARATVRTAHYGFALPMQVVVSIFETTGSILSGPKETEQKEIKSLE
jgi:hypothetical protein